MKKVLVGRKMTKANIYKRLILSVLKIGIPYYFVWLLMTVCLRVWFHMPNMGGFVALFFLPFFIHNMKEFFENFFVNQYLEVTDDYLGYNQMTENQTVFDEAWALLKNKPYQPSVYIKMEDLISIRLGYQTGFGWRLHPQAVLEFECILRDGSVARIKMYDLVSKEGQWLEVLNIFEKNGIYVSDPYHIKPALEKDNIYFQEYILKLDKKEKQHEY